MLSWFDCCGALPFEVAAKDELALAISAPSLFAPVAEDFSPANEPDIGGLLKASDVNVEVAQSYNNICGSKAESAWKALCFQVLQNGGSEVCRAIAETCQLLRNQRKDFKDAVIAFVFDDLKVHDSTQSASNWLESLTSKTIVRTPRCLRLSLRERNKFKISIEESTDSVAGIASIAALKLKECEVLLNRRTLPVAELNCVQGSSSQLHRSEDSVLATDFSFAFALPCVPWFFSALAGACLNGPISALVKQHISGNEALAGLSTCWPQMSTFFQSVTEEDVELKASLTSHGCVDITLRIPVDMSAVEQRYPEVATDLRIFQTCRLRFVDKPAAMKSAGTVRQALLATWGHNILTIRFVVHGHNVAWTDAAFKPSLRSNGSVDVVEAPVATDSDVVPRELLVFLEMDEIRLRLTEFSCLAIGSLHLPDVSLSVKVTSDKPSRVCSDPGSKNIAPEARASLVFRILSVSPFPAESLIWPFFDIRLLRKLLVETFELAWHLDPSLDNPDRWHMTQTLRCAFPKVARALKSCLRSFAQAQVSKLDWVQFFSDIFFAAALDVQQFEGQQSQQREHLR